jgi:acyl carrier protein
MLEEFRKILKEYYEIADVELTSNFKKDFDLTSFDFVNLICIIEEQYDIEIEEDQYRSLNTIGELIEYIESIQ